MNGFNKTIFFNVPNELASYNANGAVVNAVVAGLTSWAGGLYNVFVGTRRCFLTPSHH
jgi:hypothetical protein